MHVLAVLVLFILSLRASVAGGLVYFIVPSIFSFVLETSFPQYLTIGLFLFTVFYPRLCETVCVINAAVRHVCGCALFFYPLPQGPPSSPWVPSRGRGVVWVTLLVCVCAYITHCDTYLVRNSTATLVVVMCHNNNTTTHAP